MKYRKFVKNFAMFYIAANVLIALLLVMFAPKIIDKYFKGELTIDNIASEIIPANNPEYDRVVALSEGLDVGVIVIKECPNDVEGNVLACYLPHLKKTYVTKLGLMQNDFKLVCTLHHEAIHKWQHDTGKIEFDIDGNILNVEELEEYAYANDGC